jgi:RecB family exonuclease
VIALESYRQSLLAGFETCPRRTRFSLEAPDDLPAGYVGASGDLGRLVHDVYAEILRTMHRQGEEQISTQEAVEIMREVDAVSGVVLPADERETLLYLSLRFAEFRFDTRRIIAIEQQMDTDVFGQDGKPRRLTGRPDVLMADPPDGIVIVDYKSGWAVPKSPRKPPPEGEPIIGKKYLSDRGHMQLDIYGLLGLRTYPAASHATLRELHLRSGGTREATLTREDLEHVEREVGTQMQKLERATGEGPESELWRPRPGRHCYRACPVAASCPIPPEQRGDGAIVSPADADEHAALFALVDARRQQLREQLKMYHEESGYAPKVGDGNVLRWKKKDSGGRSFDMWPPDDNDNGEASV